MRPAGLLRGSVWQIQVDVRSKATAELSRQGIAGLKLNIIITISQQAYDAEVYYPTLKTENAGQLE